MQEQRSLSWRLSWYRQSELEGALLLGRLVRRVTDAYLVTRLTRHCADEARHSWLWAQTLESLSLSAVAIRRSYQSFYLDQIGRPRSVIDVLALTHVFEQRVHRHFRDELSHPDVPAAARTTFGRLLRDEQQHLDWVGRWLAAQSASPALLSRYRDVDEQVARRLAPYRDRLWDVEGLGEELVDERDGERRQAQEKRDTSQPQHRG
jgi:tRNA isopentenyl-2-thiomethyl-A-37 hydroxylase MiaE